MPRATWRVVQPGYFYDFTGGKKTFQLKAGQYKVPFGRQQLTSSFQQQAMARTTLLMQQCL